MKKILILIIACAFLPRLSLADVAVQIDTGATTVNAVEGSVRLPSGANATSVSTGNSAILFWLEEPKTGSSTISFSGITPGGFSGKHALFTISGDIDPASLAFDGVSALKNDGAGTAAKVTLSAVSTTMVTDVDPPESFALTVSSSTALFDGKPFVVFQTQDKASGIDHYDIATTWFLSPSAHDWHKATSPVMLSSFSKRIFVRAVDKAGNVRIESLTTPESEHRWALVAGFGILIVLAFAIFVRLACSKRAP